MPPIGQPDKLRVWLLSAGLFFDKLSVCEGTIGDKGRSGNLRSLVNWSVIRKYSEETLSVECNSRFQHRTLTGNDL
jgi:hypothetical protein